MIYLLDTNVVAEITTRPKPAPAVVAWARSVPSPALYLSVITVAEIEAGIEGTPDPVRRTAFERALTDIRDQYRDRIAAVGEREAFAYLALPEAQECRNQHRSSRCADRRHRPGKRLDAGESQHQASGAIRRTPAEPLGVRGIGHRGRNARNVGLRGA
ncbi:hypothetical protein OG429_18900 [Streptomyces sp. NBC_00190]|uniref:PIN domain-containing protein n=1 Tax=unclassified Streptomyces TaxID=2593676 RepID=UPI002E29922B|nr:PIN domain-containing protein [Streptomyces sp. NBC_00190]WSZ41160.1 hypothetical protein OG239_21685 [Streptomyces sp. NBC_00868]